MAEDQSWRSRLYGKITGGQLERVLADFSEIWEDRTRHFSEEPDNLEERLKNLAAIPNWVELYRRPLLEIFAMIAVVTNTVPDLEHVAASEDKIEALAKMVKAIPDEVPDHPLGMPLAWVLLANLDAVARYSRTVNDMLAAAARGNGQAFFDALSVDSQLVSLPGCLAALRLGQLHRNHFFAEAVFASIRGPHKRRSIYAKLRWAEYLLRDQGAFEACTQDELYELLVIRLELYGEAEHKDPKRSLFELFRKWKKAAPT